MLARRTARSRILAAVSVFLEIPEASWVAANELAFAFRDRYPVSGGHTLVVTRRVVPDWFSASKEERVALLDLVDEVKRQLDRELQPRRAGWLVEVRRRRATDR